MKHPDTIYSQETLEEMIALQAYAAELHAQAASFEEVTLELILEREHWCNPELLLT
jgi:hypothetical protein